jgi:hypothetical protein
VILSGIDQIAIPPNGTVPTERVPDSQ